MLTTLVDRKIKDVTPSKSAWIESWGFLLLGIGVFLGLACYSFSPSDFRVDGSIKANVKNFAGPVGAWTATQVLGRFGVIGMVIPAFLAVWGGLVATGFVILPKPRRFFGFFALASAIAGYMEMLMPFTAMPEPSFGFGGAIGVMLQSSFVPALGFGGTLIVLSVLAIVIQVLVGNLHISRTAEFFNMASRVVFKWVVFGFKYVWIRGVLNRNVIHKNGKITGSYVPNTEEEESIARNSVRRSAASSAAAQSNKANMANRLKKRALEQENAAEEEKTNGFNLVIDYTGPSHQTPSANMFSKSKDAPTGTRNFEKEAIYITEQLAQFKIDGKITKVTQGPVVTTYEFEPAPGTKLSKISALGEDLARMMKAQSLRVLAPIPGKDTVGFEVPNKERGIIGFRDLMEDPNFHSNKRALPIAMGVDIFGKPVVADLAEMPHLLVAGSTGAGKSVFMNTLIGSLIAKHSAKDLRLIMVDPKMVEMAVYNDLPHMACPVITDPQGEALDALHKLVDEMEDRYKRMRAVGAKNITGFNQIVKTKRKGDFKTFQGKWTAMPYVVLIIDEMADMMMVLGKEVERPITRLAQKARACGIHLVIATQRPSADVVTGLIKANFPTRVAFRVLSGIDSRTILDTNGAETLLGKGDMLHLAAGGANRVHGAFLPDDEVTKMVKVCTKRK